MPICSHAGSFDRFAPIHIGGYGVDGNALKAGSLDIGRLVCEMKWRW
jgi:hypothetical protein